MRFIPKLVTSRITASIKELSIGSIIDLCNTPTEYNELGISKTIAAIVEETNLPLEQWTAQERYAAMLHYYYCVYFDSRHTAVLDEETGAVIDDYFLENKDYPVPKSNKFAQPHQQPLLKYDIVLDKDSEQPDFLWMLPLTGEWIEAVERVVLGGYIKQISDNVEIWRIATAAAQILPRGITHEEAIKLAGVSIDKFISDNANLILAMKSSDYEELMRAFDKGTEALDHIVTLRLSASGFCLEGRKGGGDALPSLRFLFNALLGIRALGFRQRSA